MWIYRSGLAISVPEITPLPSQKFRNPNISVASALAAIAPTATAMSLHKGEPQPSNLLCSEATCRL
ncbi:hypothetical protein J6590_029018 [Homalodisca vitripennis]|nr:hypothetical protein J6590_029018 [Homalodisca vitripennis]